MADSSGRMEREPRLIQVGILTVSDSCYAGNAEDKSGKNLKQLIEAKHLLSAKIIHGDVATKEIVPDELDKIKGKLVEWSDYLKLDLILTTGGTGFSQRDVTPEATKAVLEREAIGITVAMIVGSLKITSLSMLSRLTCGIRGKTLIINLPGSTKGAEECFRMAVPAIPHAVDLLKGDSGHVKATHEALQSHGVVHSHPTLQSHGVRHGDFSLVPPSAGHDNHPVQSLSSGHSDSQFGSERSATATHLDHRQHLVTSDYAQNASSQHQDITVREPVSIRLPTKPILLSNAQDDISNDSDARNLTDVGHGDGSVIGTQPTRISDISDFNKFYFVTDPSNQTQQHIIVRNKNEVTGSNEKDVSNELDLFDDNPDDVEATDDISDQYIIVRPLNTETMITETNVTMPVKHTVTSENVDAILQTTNSNMTDSQGNMNKDVYDFEDTSQHGDGESNSSTISLVIEKVVEKPSSPILKANIHKSSSQGEVILVPVGTALKDFLKSHPLICGIYLNKGKRDLKREFVNVKRQDHAVDTGSWKRGKHIHERNRFDDWFEYTEAGQKKKYQVDRKKTRDMYVVNWYVWCPGHGNCLRRCGEYGRCKTDCQGKNHRQDRHNCSFMVNLKLYLSDLNLWRVHITGSHIPPQLGIVWEPPPPHIQRLSEDKRDAIILHSKEITNSSKIMEVLTSDPVIEMEEETISKRKISRFVSSMKKRRKHHSYDCKNVCLSIAERSSQDTMSCDMSKVQDKTIKKSIDSSEIKCSSAGKVEQGKHAQLSVEEIVAGPNVGDIVAQQIVGDGVLFQMTVDDGITHLKAGDSVVQSTVGENVSELKHASPEKNLTVIKYFKIVDSFGNVTCINTSDKLTKNFNRIESSHQVASTLPVHSSPKPSSSCVNVDHVQQEMSVPEDSSCSSDIVSLLASCQQHHI